MSDNKDLRDRAQASAIAFSESCKAADKARLAILGNRGQKSDVSSEDEFLKAERERIDKNKHRSGLYTQVMPPFF